jgi:hypothetical protein
MKDCTTFLKLQEAALNKQAEAKRQGYEGNTNNAPASQQGNYGVPQGQDQPNQGHDNDGGYVPSKGDITAMIQLKGICPRGNNKVVIILFRVHNRCLFLMLELY